ncbi:hypothetical protein GJ496_008983 [Pomphorhynchus laevis]|nr:hypothetical protein GJ496_008983 [Pomphorhynchus laevis]
MLGINCCQLTKYHLSIAVHNSIVRSIPTDPLVRLFIRGISHSRKITAPWRQSLRDVQIITVYADDEGREQNHSTNDPAVLAATTKPSFGLRRSACPARNSTCNWRDKVRHFSKVCRSKPKQKSCINVIDTHHNDSRLTTVLLKSMGKDSLQIAEQTIKLNGSDVIALFDNCSSENFIDFKLVNRSS